MGIELEARVKEDFAMNTTVKETRPVMGGALQKKLAALKNK